MTSDGKSTEWLDLMLGDLEQRRRERREAEEEAARRRGGNPDANETADQAPGKPSRQPS